MTTYDIIDGFVYMNKVGLNYRFSCIIGKEKKIVTSINENKTILKWHRFDISTGDYVEANHESKPIEYNGNFYTPVNGVVEIETNPIEISKILGIQLSEVKIENMKLYKFISNIVKENAKTRLEIMKIKKEVNN